jgi:c-di-GMP-binding flagellar brake protein YcgR
LQQGGQERAFKPCWVRREDAQRNRIYRLGLMFLGMPESMRSRIVRFVFGIEKSAVRG